MECWLVWYVCISGSSLKMTEDILGYTTTDSPSFARMKLGILCCNCKYSRCWSPSRHGIHNLYRMSDEVTINLRWMIGRSPFFALMPLVTMYDTTINSGWGTDTEDWIYISISIAKMQIVDLQIVCDCGCTMLHSGWEVWNADSLHRSVSKNAIILHGMYICSCLIEQGTNKESINFQYNNQPNKYSHCQRLNRNKLIYKHDNIWALMYWSMTFYVAKQAYMHDLKA